MGSPDESVEKGKEVDATKQVPPAVTMSGLRRSESVIEIAKALLKFQLKIDVIPRSAKNPHFKSKYADLAAIWKVIRKPLSESGINVIHGPQSDGEKVTITTLILHESGEWFESDFTMSTAQNRITGPQALGSCVTYGKRYGMCAMLNIVPDGEDDDAEAAEGRTDNKSKRPAESSKGKPAAAKKKKKTEWKWTKEGDPDPVWDKGVKKYKCKTCVNHCTTRMSEQLAAYITYCECGYAHNWEAEVPKPFDSQEEDAGEDQDGEPKKEVKDDGEGGDDGSGKDGDGTKQPG